MTTVINTPGNNTSNGENGAGWAVVVIILLAVVSAGVYLWMNYESPPQTSDTTNINVTVPTPIDTSNTPNN